MISGRRDVYLVCLTWPLSFCSSSLHHVSGAPLSIESSQLVKVVHSWRWTVLSLYIVLPAEPQQRPISKPDRLALSNKNCS